MYFSYQHLQFTLYISLSQSIPLSSTLDEGYFCLFLACFPGCFIWGYICSHIRPHSGLERQKGMAWATGWAVDLFMCFTRHMAVSVLRDVSRRSWNCAEWTRTPRTHESEACIASSVHQILHEQHQQVDLYFHYKTFFMLWRWVRAWSHGKDFWYFR